LSRSERPKWDWIATGADQYLERAVEFAQRARALAELRASLRERMQASAL
jgi:predicted O-linked N-acetylglucosamine transferase (SPINDLY family)